MPLQPVILPDAEALLTRYLTGRPELAGVKVSTSSSPDVAPGESYITLTLLPAGPTNADGWLDAPRFQVDAWAPDRARGSQLARLVRALLHVCRNVTYTDGVITGTRLVQRPAWLPDSTRTPPTPRYSQTVDLFTHPAH